MVTADLNPATNEESERGLRGGMTDCLEEWF
jgi:hypothetical protein